MKENIYMEREKEKGKKMILMVNFYLKEII